MQQALATLYQSPQKVITYTWLTSLVLLFITFLVMCVAVSCKSNTLEVMWHTDLLFFIHILFMHCRSPPLSADMSHGQHDRVSAFAGAWSTLLFIIISVVGTYFMSHVSTMVSHPTCAHLRTCFVDSLSPLTPSEYLLVLCL